MPGHYFTTLFGNTARALQMAAGSRKTYARLEDAATGPADPLTERELSFIAARDSAYMATVTADGWPYVQHRGGPAGFVKHLGGNRLGFVELIGNKQYISAGNISDGGRVSLFFMDYVARRRLKLIGHAALADLADLADVPALATGAVSPVAERAVLIDVIGFDWNCPQHITQRFSLAELQALRGMMISTEGQDHD